MLGYCCLEVRLLFVFKLLWLVRLSSYLRSMPTKVTLQLGKHLLSETHLRRSCKQGQEFLWRRIYLS
jgi:hypothetical protein